MYPKVVALAGSAIFSGNPDKNTWGKGPGARSKIQDNIQRVNDSVVQDLTNTKHQCKLYPEVAQVVADILKNGAKLAVVSRNTSKDMLSRTLYYFKVKDQHGKDHRLIDLVVYYEVHNPEPKTHHFHAIHSYKKEPYADMILFDAVKTANRVEMMLGVTFQHCSGGVTWSTYREGLDIWNRTKALHSPWRGLQLSAYPKQKFIGYSGMDLDTIELLEKGGRRLDRKEAARWGYAMYVADDPVVAKYFSDWIKVTAFGSHAKTIVCQIYVRDGDKWDKMNKIWVPDSRRDLNTDVKKDEATVASTEVKRDEHVVAWGVQRPYVLFSRHPNMKKRDGLQFPLPDPQRFNELVIYGQTQENLIVINRMSDTQLNQAIQSKVNLRYERKIREWGIKVPAETRADFEKHRETYS